MSSSTDQKIDWLHNLIRTSGDVSNAVMTKQSLEACLRTRNDQMYTRCVTGGGTGGCTAVFSGAHERQQRQNTLVGGGEEAVFLAQVRDTLGSNVSPPTRSAGEDLLSWKNRVVDTAAQTFTELYARLLSGGDRESEPVQQLKSATRQLKAQLGDGGGSVMAVLSQCGGVNNSVINDLKTRLQQLNSMTRRLGGGGFVQATAINDLLRQTVDTLERYAKRIQSDVASKGEFGRKLQAALAQQKQDYEKLQADKATLETRLQEMQTKAEAARRAQEQATSAASKQASQLQGMRTAQEQATRAASTQAAELKNTHDLNAQLQTNFDEKAKAFGKEHTGMVEQLDEKRKEIAQLQTELHKSQKAYDNAKEGLTKALEKEQKQCHVEDEALAAFNAQLEKLKAVLAGGALLEGGATARDILEQASEMVTLALDKVLSMQQALTKTQQEKMDAHAQHNKAHSELTSSFTALQAQKTEALAAAAEEKQKALAAANEEKQKALAAANEEKQKALAAANEENQKELAAANEENQKELAAAAEEKQKALAAAADEKQKDLAAAADEKQKALAAAKAHCAVNAGKSTAKAQREKKEALTQAERQLDAAVAEADNRKVVELEQLQSQHAAALTQAERQLEAAVAAADNQKVAELEQLQSQHAAALSEEQDASKTAEINYNTDAAQSRADMTAMSNQLQEMKGKLEAMQTQLAGATKRANAAETTAAAEQARADAAQIDDTDQAYRSFQEQLEALRSTLDESSADLAEAQSNEELFKKKS